MSVEISLGDHLIGEVFSDITSKRGGRILGVKSIRAKFFDDNENEFLVMLEGIKSKHISSRAKKAILIKSQFVIWLIFLPLLLFPPNLF